MADGKFYFRSNTQVLQMEEYQVRQAYSLREKTELEILDCYVDSFGGSGKIGNLFDWKDFTIRIQVRNISNSIEDKYKVVFKLPTRLLISKNVPELEKHFVNFEDNYSKYVVPGLTPIFQDETAIVFSFSIRVTHSILTETPFDFHIKLFYSNGIKERIFTLRDHIKLDGQFLMDLPWRK